MAITWEEFISTPEYQKYDDKQKDNVRQQYFQSVIAPEIPAEHRETAFQQFNQHAIKTESNFVIDKEIAELESKVVLEPEWSTKMARSFGFGVNGKEEAQRLNAEQRDRERLEFLRQRKKDNNPETTLEHYKSAAKRNMQDSTIGKTIETYMMDGKNPTAIVYEPESTGERIAGGLARIGADLPLYALGSGVTTGGMIAKSAGSFALPKAIDKTLDIRRENGKVGLSDYDDIALEAAKGGVEGALFGGAGLAGNFAKSFVKNPVTGELVKLGVETPLETAIMAGSTKAQGGELTGETWGEIIGTLGAMKLIHANPYALRALKKQSEITGIPVEKLAENIKLDPTQAKILKDAEVWNRAAEESALRTETQIKNEYKNRVQDEVIDKQIRANYKDGKPLEEIVKLEQIPTEYLPHVADMVEGKAVVKPEILQKLDNIVNKRDPLIAQKYEDILPGQMRDMIQRDRQQIVDNHTKAQEELAIKKDIRSLYEEQRGKEFEELIKREQDILLGDYRRYANQPKMREKMDKAIDHTLNIMTHEEKANVALDPSSIRNFIDSKESGFADLKPNYQKAVMEEIAAKCMKETNIYPKSIFEQAVKRAETKLKYEDKRYQEPVRELEQTVQSLEAHPEYQAHLKELQGKPDIQVKQELEGKLNNIKLTAEQELQANLTNFQRVMGVSSEYGPLANDKAMYGRQYNDYVEFMKMPVADMRKVFEKAAFMKYKPYEISDEGVVTINNKTSLINKFRAVKMQLGDDVYRLVYENCRVADTTLHIELNHYKKTSKERRKDWKSDESKQLGLFAIGQQSAGEKTLLNMGKDKVEWNSLSDKQKAMYNEGRKIFDMIFDRINRGRIGAGVEPLKKVGDYFTLMRKFDLMERLGYDPHTITNTAFDKIEVGSAKMKAMSFQYGKSRVQSDKAVETDYLKVLDKYVQTSLKAIHYTPYIGKMRQAISSKQFRVSNPKGYAYMDMLLNTIAGKRISEASDVANYAATVAHRNLSGATLAFNVGTVVKQFTAPFMSIPEIGPLYLAKGVKDFQSESMRKFCMKESNHMSGRVFDATVSELEKSVTGMISAAQVKGIEIGMIGTKYADLISSQITWFGGYRYAKESLKLNHKGCVFYADDLVVRTQGSANRADIAPIQHTPIGKFFTTFGTYSINQFGYIKDEILGLGKRANLIAQGISKAEADFKYQSEGYIVRPIGNKKVNVYQEKRYASKADSLKKGIALAVTMTAVNTVYEMIDPLIPDFINLDSPTPAPISAMIEGMTGQEWTDFIYGEEPSEKKTKLVNMLLDDGFMKGLYNVVAEGALLLPVAGGSLKYGGGNAAGAGAALLVDVLNTISGRPNSKPIPELIGKLSGIPGTTQTIKILRELQKERIAENRKSKDPLSDIKRQMQQSNPFHKQSQSYKDPGLVEGLFQ